MFDNTVPPTTQAISPYDGNGTRRLLSLDVFRGLIMCSLAANGFALAATAKNLGYGPDAYVESVGGMVWQTLAFHNAHPAWNSQFYLIGCSYWDLIQPAFMFMVGVAMPYSYASRQRRGDSQRKLVLHALTRAVVLVLLGMFLQTRNNGLNTNALFTNVLGQIGLGYFFVFLVMSFGAKVQIAIGLLVLGSYTAWMNLFTVPEPLPEKSLESIQTLLVPLSIEKQYAFGVNAAAQTDLMFLRWLLGDGSISLHPGGYATFNFVPSAVTMLLGVASGKLLRGGLESHDKVRKLFLAGVVCMVLAVVLSLTLCPIIKRIWTPSWTLLSGAYVLWTLAALYWLVDVRQSRRWTFPLVVVGTNSLAMYMMSMLWKRWIADRFEVYFGDQVFADEFGPMRQAILVFVVLWLICFYLYRQKLFFRV